MDKEVKLVEIKFIYHDDTTNEIKLGEFGGKLTICWEKLTAEYPSVSQQGYDRVFFCGNKLIIAEEYDDSEVTSTYMKSEKE